MLKMNTVVNWSSVKHRSHAVRIKSYSSLKLLCIKYNWAFLSYKVTEKTFFRLFNMLVAFKKVVSIKP